MFLRVKVHVVGHVALSERHLRLYHGVAALVNVEHGGVVDHWPHVGVVFRHLRKREQGVDVGEDVGVDLYLRYELLHVYNQLREQLRLKFQNLLVGAKYLLLILFQLWRDVSLCLCQGLLPYPVGRHAVLERVAHFKVIAEHVVVAHLQRGDACRLGLTLLYLQQVVLSAARDVPQLVELLAVSLGNHVAFRHELWRVGLYLLLYPVAQALTEVHLLAEAFQAVVVGVEASRLYGLYGLQCRLQLHHLAWRHPAHGHL